MVMEASTEFCFFLLTHSLQLLAEAGEFLSLLSYLSNQHMKFMKEIPHLK